MNESLVCNEKDQHKGKTANCNHLYSFPFFPLLEPMFVWSILDFTGNRQLYIQDIATVT